jgi:hypothetical protein
MEIIVFVQRNLWVVKNLATRAPLKQFNLDTIDITKVPSMPLRNEEEEDHYAFLQQEAIERQLQRRWGRQVRPTPLLDLENFDDNVSSLKSDDYVRNFDHDANNQRVQIDCEETQQDNDETQEGEFGLNEDRHWHRLVPSDEQDDELESCRHVCQRFTNRHQIYSQDH